MLWVGMTGGIATGKSQAAQYFRMLGAPVLDADDVTHLLAAPGSETLAAIADLAGSDILTHEGALDRRRLRTRAFADAGLRNRLEQELHPRVQNVLGEWRSRQVGPYALCVVPLLVEAGWQGDFDRVLVLHCSREEQLRRLHARTALPADEAEAILNAQCTASERLQHADDTLDTGGSLEDLRAAVGELHAKYETS